MPLSFAHASNLTEESADAATTPSADDGAQGLPVTRVVPRFENGRFTGYATVPAGSVGASQDNDDASATAPRGMKTLPRLKMRTIEISREPQSEASATDPQ